jgi:hypothetical protein
VFRRLVKFFAKLPPILQDPANPHAQASLLSVRTGFLSRRVALPFTRHRFYVVGLSCLSPCCRYYRRVRGVLMPKRRSFPSGRDFHLVGLRCSLNEQRSYSFGSTLLDALKVESVARSTDVSFVSVTDFVNVGRDPHEGGRRFLQFVPSRCAELHAM